MAFEFKGRTAFITGGASGAGFGQAKVFGREDCNIVIADIRGPEVQSAVEALRAEGIKAHGIQLDVTDRAAFAEAATEAEAAFGPVTMLFGTAGVSIFGPLEKSSYDDYDWIMGVNFGGIVNLMQTFVPRMIESDMGGHIVNTASLGCFFTGSVSGIYSASKFAVHGITMAMRDALKDYGIGVSVLAPANIKSNIADSYKVRPEKFAHSGYALDEKEVEALHEIYSQGLEPEELAGHVKQAIVDNQFYIIPYPEARAGLEAIFQQALDALPPPDSDKAGQEKRMKAMLRYIEARRNLDTARYGKATR